MQLNSHLDPQLVDKIVHEVKSQGVFDEFRKSSMADVDTKPAYQNLRQRVETTVKRFLSEQKWSPEMNKNQLRERLRKHITDSGFLDVGVERIVDQVVNPKIGTVFQPRIEDIAYKYLGVPKPIKMEVMPILPQLPAFPVNGNSLRIETCHLLPTDLEQVSPDSDKATVKSECRDECIATELEVKTDEDDESPPFEPLELNAIATIKIEAEKKDEELEKIPLQKSDEPEDKSKCIETKMIVDTESQDNSSVSQKTEEHDSEKEAQQNNDVFHDSHSQLSQVSSTSCLSTDTRDNNNGSSEYNTKSHENAVNISEEAQMPKFSENSNEEKPSKGELHFDIKQDEIKFEGTKRNVDLQRTDFASITSDGTEKDSFADEQSKVADPPITPTEIGLFQKQDDVSNDLSFKFKKIYVESNVEQPVKEKSSSASLEDSGTAQLCIVDKSENTQISSLDFHPTFEQRSKDKDNEAIDSQNVPPPSNSTIDCSFSEKRETNESQQEDKLTSLSQSRHSKKHSKHKKSEKYRYRDKEREKEKEKSRHREKYEHRREKSPSSGNKKSSSSQNKHSSSKTLSSGGNRSSDLYNRNSPNLSNNPSKHSSSTGRSKTSRDDEKRYSDKRHQQSSSSSSSSSHKKGDKDKKSKNSNDDHYSSKDKMSWRKSTDSNDEDKKPDRVSGKSNYKSASDSSKAVTGESSGNYKKENSSAMTPSSSNAAAQCKNEGTTEVTVARAEVTEENVSPKIVILNEILQNPSTDFIELNASTQENRMHIVHSEDKPEELGLGEELSNYDLRFFEQNTGQFNQRLKLIDNAIDRCRKVVNCLRFDSSSPTDTNYMNNFTDIINASRSYFAPTGTKRNSIGETRATLHIDCIQYTKTPLNRIDFEEQVDTKRLKLMQGSTSMVSPTLSDVSVNSKENEFIPSDMKAVHSRCAKKTITIDGKRGGSTLSKLSHQRYTNDDLYKPRIFLGQRSRREIASIVK